MNLEKFRTYCYKIICSILLIFVIYVIYFAIFNIYQVSENLKPIVILLGAIVGIMFFITLGKVLDKINRKTINKIAICICIIFFLGMSIVGVALNSIPSTDLSMIIREINIMVNNGGKFVSESYFARVTNQTPIAILLYFIYKIGLFINIPLNYLKGFATIINSLFVTISAFFIYLSVKNIKGEKSAVITLLFFVLNPIFYLYSSYFYTDTLCMPFAAISIYLYICSIDKNDIKKKVLLLMGSGFVLALGFEIRVVLGIILIAMLLKLIFNKGNLKEKFRNSSTILLGFIIGIMIYNIISIPFGVLKNKNLEFPITHYIMYSLNEKELGKWNSSDYSITYNQKTYEEKVNANLKAIKSRIDNLRLAGWLNLAKEKIAVNWSNGDYDYLSKVENVENINSLYGYLSGNKKIFIIYYLQICKVIVMVLFLLGIVKELIRKDENKYSFLYISIFGAFLFYLFWEVLSRYSLTFLPIIILTFTNGLENIENILKHDMIKISFNDNQQRCIYIKKYLKTTGIVIITITTFFGIINFYKYAVKKDTFWDKVVVQGKNNEKGIEKIGNNEIEQTFIADKKFNSIAIRFLKKDMNVITNYVFELHNSKNILVKEKFTSDEINDKAYKTFTFKKVEPKGKEEYRIKIYSVDATDENSIGICTYYGYKNYDIYPKGVLKINENEIEQDITFKVQNENKRTYISKKIYILFMLAIITIEIFSFYPYFKTI